MDYSDPKNNEFLDEDSNIGIMEDDDFELQENAHEKPPEFDKFMNPKYNEFLDDEDYIDSGVVHEEVTPEDKTDPLDDPNNYMFGIHDRNFINRQSENKKESVLDEIFDFEQEEKNEFLDEEN